MMKKKLTALVAVLLVCLLLFPTAAFAYASDGEDTPAETPAAQSADAVPPADTTETVGNTEPADDQEDTTLPFDTDVLTTLLAGMDEELLEVLKEHSVPELSEMPVHLNPFITARLTEDSFILTSGHEKVWRFIANELGLPFYYGKEMSAETKLYITKMLQCAGKRVIAYGDGMNDYFMLKQADEGYLLRKQDGTLSRSLKGRDTEGLIIV